MPEFLRIPATFETLEHVSLFIERLTAEEGSRVRSELTLAIHELCVNIVEHAYAGASGNIDIEAEYNGDMLEIMVWDTAPNPYTPPDEVNAPDPDSLPEGGWGIFILHQVFDQVEYMRSDEGNQWRLLKALA